MAGGNKAGLFNLALASAAAGATAFAVFAMPAELLGSRLEAIGLATLIASPIGMVARLGAMAAAAALGFLLSWLALCSCDARARPAADLHEQWGLDWPAAAFGAEEATDLLFGDQALDDPFAELARHAERVEEPLELSSDQIAAERPSLASQPENDVPAIRELLAHIPAPASNGLSDLVQRLNAGLAESEWPLPSGGEDEASAEVEDRLRGVLHDLRTMAEGR